MCPGASAVPLYYNHPGANPTTYPQEPSSSTDGGDSDPQYGYMYNWCAAMGSQVGSDACLMEHTEVLDLTTSICPDGWKLPEGGVDFPGLITALGATADAAGVAILQQNWLAQASGYVGYGVTGQGVYGAFWAGTPDYGFADGYYIYEDDYDEDYSDVKYTGHSVRCLAVY